MATIRKKPAVVPAKESHIGYLAANMREKDRNEIWAIGHFTPEHAVKMSMLASDSAYSFVQGKKVLAMFGVSSPSLLCPVGIVWFMSTEEIFIRHRRTMARDGRAWLRKWLNDYDLLFNFIDVRNELSIKWLKWCGATFSEPIPYGVEKLPFMKFELKKTIEKEN